MRNYVYRYLIFILGLFINSFGIVLITKSNLGTSPISGSPFVYSLYFTHLSFGMTTFIMNMIFVVLQVLLLRKDFHPIQYLQIAANFVFSAFIDISMFILAPLDPATIPARAASLLAGCLVLAAGISTEISPEVLVVPGEGIVRAISMVTYVEFGRVKVWVDTVLMIFAAISSYIFFGGLNGLGVGTITSAVLVGRFVRLLDSRLPLSNLARQLVRSGS